MANGKTKIEERISEAGEQMEEQKKQVFEWLEEQKNIFNVDVDFIDWKDEEKTPEDWYVILKTDGKKEEFLFTAILEGKILIPKPSEFNLIEDENFQNFYKEWLKNKQVEKFKYYETILENWNKELKWDLTITTTKRKEELERHISAQKKSITKMEKKMKEIKEIKK